MSEDSYYIKPAEFLPELEAYYAELKVNPDAPWPDGICRKFIQIVNGLSKRYNFINYTYIDEMKSDALEIMMRYGKGFNPSLGYNPFSYFNRVAYRAFQQRIKKEKKQQDIKERFTIETYSQNSDAFVDGDGEMVEAIEKLVAMYDEKQKEKADD